MSFCRLRSRQWLEEDLSAWEAERAHVVLEDCTTLLKARQELEVAGGLLQDMVSHRSAGLLLASGEAAKSRAAAQKALALARPWLSAGAQVRDLGSISFKMDERSVHSVMQAISCNAVLRQSPDSALYLTLRVAVLCDFEQWHKADLCDFEQVLDPTLALSLSLSLSQLHLTRTLFHCACVRQVTKFKVKRTSTLREFKSTAAEAFGIPVARQRYWRCLWRTNQTIRPHQPLSAQEEECVLEELLFRKNSPAMKLFLEASSAPVEEEQRPHMSPPLTSKDALIFFKYYDPEEEELHFVCPLIVKIADPIASVLPHVKQEIGLKPKQKLILFEEIAPTTIERLYHISRTSFQEADLSNGDIICVQRCPPKDAYPMTLDEHYMQLSLVSVSFCSVSDEDEGEFVLQLSTETTYDDVVEHLADELNYRDSCMIRLRKASAENYKPLPSPIKNRPNLLLRHMLADPLTKVLPDVLFYEMLDYA
jgi:hypothetical protein